MRTIVLGVVGAILLVGLLFVPGQLAGPEIADQDTPTNESQLDLRESNVIGVAVTEADSSYTFDVTLIHDDDGEEGYANWWLVETLEGDQLGQRDLAHAHGTQEFTRSETIEVPENVTTVVVRGHDQTHGYGGQAWLVDLESGDAITVHQGSEPVNFSDAGSVFEE